MEFLILWSLCGLAAAAIAYWRGLRPSAWLMAGFVLGPFAVLWAAVLAPRISPFRVHRLFEIAFVTLVIVAGAILSFAR